MKHTPVKSSVIQSVGYDIPSRTLELLFHSGSTYSYAKVPPGVFQALLKTPSIGGFVSKRVTPKFKATKLEEYTPE